VRLFERIAFLIDLKMESFFFIKESRLDILERVLYITGKRAFHSGSHRGEAMNINNTSEKLQTMRQQASTHNALLKINRTNRQRKQLERRLAWYAIWLAVSTLIHLEFSRVSRHAQA
jgi:negative regulator of replication initiation